jgi:hypothetical protein
MQHLLSRLVAGAIVAVLVHASVASGAALECRTFNLKIPARGAGRATTTVFCPSSTGVFNDIQSVLAVIILDVVNDDLSYDYLIDMRVAPDLNPKPAAAAVLLKSDGTVPINLMDFHLCPEAVDNTKGNGPGGRAACLLPRSNPAVKVRVLHAHI